MKASLKSDHAAPKVNPTYEVRGGAGTDKAIGWPTGTTGCELF